MAVLLLSASILSGQAAEITHNSTGVDFDDYRSWVGFVIPTGTDVAVLLPTFYSAQLGSADLNVAGLKITNTYNPSFIAGSGPGTLVIGSQGIDMRSVGLDWAYNAGTINLVADQTWEVSSGRSLSLTGTNRLIGSGVLTLKGSGTFGFLKSTGANTYSGGTIFDNTTVVYTAAIVSGSMFGSGNITIKGNNSLYRTSDNSQLQNFLNKFIFFGTQSSMTIGTDASVRSYTAIRGGMEIGSGTHRIGLYSELNNRSNANTALTLNGQIAGAGSGSSTLIVRNENSGTNEVFVRVQTGTVSNVNLEIGENVRFAASSSGLVGSDVSVTANGILDLGVWTNTGNSAWSQTITALRGTGTTTNSAAAAAIATLTIDGGVSTGTSTFAGVITNGGVSSGTLGLTKAGANTQILTGASTYSGTTRINGGKLLVQGAGAINGTAEVIVNGGAFIYDNDSGALNRNVTLNGGAFYQRSTQNYTGTLTFTSGTLGGSNLSNQQLLIGENQVLAPGSSTGEMTAESAEFASNGTLQMEINDATDTAGSLLLGWDLLTLSNGLSITATIEEKFVIQIVSLNADQEAGLALNFDSEGEYQLLFLTSDSELTSFQADKFQLDLTGFENEYVGSWAIVRGDEIGLSSSDLYITYAIPEPSTWALMIGSLALVAVLRRRRTTKPSLV